MSQTKFSMFVNSEVEKTRSIPWTDGSNRKFGAFFFRLIRMLPPLPITEVGGAWLDGCCLSGKGKGKGEAGGVECGQLGPHQGSCGMSALESVLGVPLLICANQSYSTLPLLPAATQCQPPPPAAWFMAPQEPNLTQRMLNELSASPMPAIKD